MGKFKVGDEARLNCARGKFKIGDIVKVIETDFQDEIFPYLIKNENETGWTSGDSLEKVNTKNQRIEALEKRVNELELIVHELRGCKVVEPSTDGIEDKQDVQRQTVERPKKEPRIHISLLKTPNQLRAEIIEKAKGFVKNAGSKDIDDDYWVNSEDGQQYCCKVEFVVSKDKRKIVALMRGVKSGKVRIRGIAKCNPSDVFNEHIGKAIALGRALGLDVSEFEGAVQPTEVVVGMVFDSNWGIGYENETCYHVDGEKIYNYPNKEGWFYKHDIKRIINDTNAIYGEVE